VQPEHRLTADGQVKVTRLLGADSLKQLVDEQRTHVESVLPSSPRRQTPEASRLVVFKVGKGLTLSHEPGVRNFVSSQARVAFIDREAGHNQFIRSKACQIKRNGGLERLLTSFEHTLAW
jgi:hypothetical protein